jgi:C-lobe and N-lobe beta barrels of Tf-binding protein B
MIPTMETKLMRILPFVPLLLTTAMALVLGACQTASNAPNAFLTPASPAGTTAATTGATPGSVPLKNETLDNFLVPQTFKTFSATQTFKTNLTTTETKLFQLNAVFDPAVAPSTTPTFAGYTLGGLTGGPSYSYSGGGQYYEAEQPQNLSEKLQITRDPRDATYSIVIAAAGVSRNLRWQDPAHRTLLPQTAIPVNAASGRQLYTDYDVPRGKPNIEYFESGNGLPGGYVANTLFFERVGVNTKYVTWMGYRTTEYTATDATTSEQLFTDKLPYTDDTQRDTRTITENSVTDRSAFVYGINTIAKDVPKTGSATYTGSLFANSISGATFETIWGTAETRVNFATDAVDLKLAGTFENSRQSFTATGTALVQRPDIPNTALNPSAEQPVSRLVGGFSQMTIGTTTFSASPNASLPNTFQAGTIEGGFFGPGAAEVGGAFRIVGGQPDTRIDVMGAFTGKKN